jgi:hypothetical protein
MGRTTWTFGTLLAAGLCLAPCATAGLSANPPALAKNTVLVADGQGGQGGITDNLAQLVNIARMPLYVEQFNWSTLHAPTDFHNQYNFAVKGQQLANRVLNIRENCPGAKIYLLGHGAGTSVVLQAANRLPPGSVTRIILLASTVSCGYDLRPALAASAEGIDSFYSGDDLILQLAIRRFGPTDLGVKGVTCAAGINGFDMVSPNLRQHSLATHQEIRGGGHLVYEKVSFIQNNIMPLFSTIWGVNSAQPTPPAAPPCPKPAPPQFPPPTPPAPPSSPQTYPPPLYPQSPAAPQTQPQTLPPPPPGVAPAVPSSMQYPYYGYPQTQYYAPYPAYQYPAYPYYPRP